MEPGLYDNKGKLIADWNALKKAGLNVIDDCDSVNVDVHENADILAPFCGRKSKCKLVLPDDIGKIGKYAFYSCLKIDEVVLQDGVTKIGEGAFAGSNISKINVPDSVTVIEDDAFNECSKLTDINLSKNLEVLGCGVFACCYELNYIDIPKGVKKINAFTFMECSNLVSINLPEGITEIDDEAFSQCEELKDIILPKTLIRIGFMVFVGCDGLEEVTIPKDVEIIGVNVFEGCPHLEIINASDYTLSLNPEFKHSYSYEIKNGRNTSLDELINTRGKSFKEANDILKSKER